MAARGGTDRTPLPPRGSTMYETRWLDGRTPGLEPWGRYVVGYTMGGKGKVPLEHACGIPRYALPDVSYQPAPHGCEQGDDAKRAAQPSPQCGLWRKCAWPRLSEGEGTQNLL